MGTYCKWFRSILVFLISFGILSRMLFLPLIIFIFLLFSSSYQAISGLHALHMLPLHFLLSMGWWYTSCIRCIVMINHIRYLDCFGIMVLASSLSFVSSIHPYFTFLLMDDYFDIDHFDIDFWCLGSLYMLFF